MPTKLIYFLYRALQIVALPLLVLYVIWRGLRDRRYFGTASERLGFLRHSFERTAPGAIWLHAVSVGEVLSAVELIGRIRAAVPGVAVFVSTTTLAGRAAANEKLAGVADGVFYLPFDYVSAVRRVLRTIRPALLVVMETEIWPNLFREVKRSGAGLMIVNGRISDRALPRYRAQQWFFRFVLRHADAILAQSEQDRARFLAAGAPARRVTAAGNLKYDFEPGANSVPPAVAELLARGRPPEVWIAASTTAPVEPGDPDEDDVVIAAFRELAKSHSGLLLIVAPRKPERFDSVARKLSGMPHLRRSRITDDSVLPLPGILLLDTIGELGSLFGKADVVFMGGTLPRRGGHNILEPALSGCPVIAGPRMENFAAIAREFTDAGALVRIADGTELAGAVDGLLRDPERRGQIAARGLALAESKRGATARAVAEIRRLHGEALPRAVRSFVGRLLLWPLALIWAAGSRSRQRRERALRKTLTTPVISVGGICMGGAGKTPFVLWLAEHLQERGCAPAILTRGYRRRTPQKLTIVPPGGVAPVALTGDEAQIFVRAGVGPVGISADRFAAGEAVEREFRPGVFLLDDGFQHQRLARDLDIVLIDSLDPLAGGGLFPVGRLREPVTALRRAGAFVLTRTEQGRDYSGVERLLRASNAGAPIYHARIKPLQWHCGDERWAAGELPFRTTAAFCGLANPAAFWRTLDVLGLRHKLRFAFGDHHTYRPAELTRLASQAGSAGAEALLTTEKDFMNLPPDAADIVAPLRLCWLQIGVEVVQEDDLLRLSMSSSRLLKSNPPE